MSYLSNSYISLSLSLSLLPENSLVFNVKYLRTYVTREHYGKKVCHAHETHYISNLIVHFPDISHYPDITRLYWFICTRRAWDLIAFGD